MAIIVEVMFSSWKSGTSRPTPPTFPLAPSGLEEGGEGGRGGGGGGRRVGGGGGLEALAIQKPQCVIKNSKAVKSRCYC